MSPLDNPFAPGAGTPPPELAGRDELLDAIHIATERTRRRNSARSVLLLGLRGVGKTVLLDRVHDEAQGAGLATVMLEVTDRNSLPALLAAELHPVLLRLSRQQRVHDLAVRALRVLAGFVSGLKLKYGDFELAIDAPVEPGVADSGNLELDLTALFEALGAAASASDTALVVIVDEMQYVPKAELSALSAALHRAAQRRLPILLAAAGLPQLRGRVAEAKTYAERLFEFREVGPLDEKASGDAVAKPIRARNADIAPDALQTIVEETRGYPYFLQEWGKHAWDVAERSPIDSGDVGRASTEVRRAASRCSGRGRAGALRSGRSPGSRKANGSKRISGHGMGSRTSSRAQDSVCRSSMVVRQVSHCPARGANEVGNAGRGAP